MMFSRRLSSLVFNLGSNRQLIILRPPFSQTFKLGRGILDPSGLWSPQDLAVQREGTFIFRYRAFDIFSTTPGGQERPILAELYGGPFRVYSTREFPGLEPSTDLTRVRVFLQRNSCHN